MGSLFIMFVVTIILLIFVDRYLEDLLAKVFDVDIDEDVVTFVVVGLFTLAVVIGVLLIGAAVFTFVTVGSVFVG